MNRSCVIPILALLVVSPHAVWSAGKVEIILEPATMSIRAEDPLFVKIRIANRSEEYVSYNHRLSAFDGTIWFETRQVGASKFKQLAVCLQGNGHGTGIWRHMEDGDEMVSHEVICRYGHDSPFANAGDYELRATLKDVRGIEGTSNSVVIQVSPIPRAEQAAIVDASLLLTTCVGSIGIPNQANLLDELSALQKKLGPSIMHSTLDWVMAIVRVREAIDLDEFERAKTDFDNLRRKMDTATRERAKLVLINEYIQMRRFDAAWHELLALKFNSSQKERLWNRFIERAVIDRIRRENAQRKPLG